MNEDKKKRSTNMPLFLGVVVLLLLIASFLGGVFYEKSVSKTVQMGTVGAFSTDGGPSDRRIRNGAFGTVTAISGSSITISEPRDNASVTYTITSATTVMNNGATVAVSDIKIGDNVVIEASSSDTKTAERIVVGVQSQGAGGGAFFNGGGQQQSSGDSGSQSQQLDTQTN